MRTICRMSRQGEFQANLVKEHQCGIEGANKFRFSCVVGVGRFDDRGFVYDQFDLPRIFNQYNDGLWYASCERLCCGFLHTLHGLLDGRATELTVRIHPTDVAFAEMMWVHGEELPASTMLPIRADNNPIRTNKYQPPKW